MVMVVVMVMAMMAKNSRNKRWILNRNDCEGVAQENDFHSQHYILTPSTVLTKETLDLYFTADDVKRLAAYTNQMLDYHAVLDLVPSLARLIFLESFGGDDGGISLSPAQLNLLVGVGLQFKSLEDLSAELSVDVNHVMALFRKVSKKFVKYFEMIETPMADDSGEKLSDLRKYGSDYSNKTNKRKRCDGNQVSNRNPVTKAKRSKKK
eukprot:TRINITY_DN8157_c0_g1_i2.p1 TRINITY_DN8157_c0_g1~~TRINITY_DN8157_c0_g1_i2.p1  ORF type:complete len:208 (-),score=49.28 TRINITY_DN8157_c0_g1_i2:134-757(-)